MTLDELTEAYERELRLLEDWMHYREIIAKTEGEAGELRRRATDLRIQECNAKLQTLENMLNLKPNNGLTRRSSRTANTKSLRLFGSLDTLRTLRGSRKPPLYRLPTEQ